MKTYRYLIGFIRPNPTGVGWGAVDFNCATPITTAEDAGKVQDALRKHFSDPQLCVLSFSLYADPSPKGGNRP